MKNILYHATNIKYLENIQKYGLLPMFGDTLTKAYSDYYNFDTSDEDVEKQKIDFDGILFFSTTPLLGFSQFGIKNFKWDQAVLCIIENNDTIFHKLSDSKFTNYLRQSVSTISHIPVENLPVFIERNDWFSF